jgi:hypothetical protein
LPGPYQISTVGGIDVNQQGPFLIGGVLYVQIATGTDTFTMWKSTNDGASWTATDSYTTATGAGSLNVSDGTSIYAVFQNPGGFGCVRIYDVSTDTFGSEIASANDYVGNTGAGYYRASDASIVICSQQPSLSPSVDDARCGFFIFDIGTSAFTSVQPCGSTAGIDGTAWQCSCVLQGDGAVCQFIFVQFPATGSGGTHSAMYAQSLTGSSVGSIITIDATGDADPFWLPGWSDGTTIVVGWQPSFDVAPQQLVVWKAPTSSMAWASETIDAGTELNTWTISITSVGIVLMLNAFITPDYPLLQYIDEGSGFGTPETVLADDRFDAGVQSSVGANSPFWALVFSDSNGIWFLSPGPITPVSAVAYYGGFSPMPLPSIGSMCRYAQPIRCKKQPYRTILSSNLLVYSRKVGN